MLPCVAPVDQPVKLNLVAAFGLGATPAAENEPKVTPVAVGGGVGSVVTLLVVTLASP